MRDLEVERLYPVPAFRPPTETWPRCPSCLAIPRAAYSTVVAVRSGAEIYVRTCSAHYCRSRAAEIARLRLGL